MNGYNAALAALREHGMSAVEDRQVDLAQAGGIGE
jgi:hypothetical protein